jgi:hypothetical protein
MDSAKVQKISKGAVFAAIVVLLATTARGTAGTGFQKTAVLHATVTVTGGVSFTGTYDTRLMVATCAEVAKSGTSLPGRSGGGPIFAVPVPMPRGGDPGSVGGGHTFATDVTAWRYHGPGTYTGSDLNATQLDADSKPGDQETHIFAFPTAIGKLIVNPDASGSFQFNGLQDPGSVKISGQVTWTCS